MKNLENTHDIKFLVDTFYQKVTTDEEIGHFFNDIAKVNWEKHLPTMYAFWDSILFGSSAYKGNPMLHHFPINDISPLLPHHFERWLLLWKSTVEENFTGNTATSAIKKAENIANLMSYKMKLARENRII